jgi:hypothetical protein
MPRVAIFTQLTDTAAGIYFAYNPFADQFLSIGLYTYADEFMADRSPKSRVAANYLEIGVADTRFEYPNECLAFNLRTGDIRQ